MHTGSTRNRQAEPGEMARNVANVLTCTSFMHARRVLGACLGVA